MNYFNVGKIVNTQGLQGEMRILSVTDFAEERFKKGNTLALFDKKDQSRSGSPRLLAIARSKTLILSSLRACTISMTLRNFVILL